MTSANSTHTSYSMSVEVKRSGAIRNVIFSSHLPIFYTPSNASICDPSTFMPLPTVRILRRSHLYVEFLICSKCLITVQLPSRNLSTQFCKQGSSLLSSFPPRIEPVMHFFQQMSVRECTARDMLANVLRSSRHITCRYWMTGKLGLKTMEHAYFVGSLPSASHSEWMKRVPVCP